MSVEDSWVFDSLVCFLHGPIWNAPLQTFIEEKSLVFDPNLQPDEDNADIKKIHDEYKNLVDYMLGSFMEEMQITPEQFELACMEGRNQQADNPFQLHQGLFHQIWAANDIKIFIRMMTQRNVELQLQALDLIEKNQLALLQDNEFVDNLSPTDSAHSHSDKYSDVEDFIVKSVEKEMESPEAALTPETDITQDDVSDKFERLNLFFEKNDKVNPDDMLSRQEYLRQQRDKIVEIKKKTRAKQLMETTRKTTTTSTGRPTSAQAAQKLLASGGHTEELLEKNGDTDLTSALQLRKTLAKRLRAEVVEQQ
ncbi:cilia- and flagella-associated protein 36 [Teleopsis dalmanni]|uniref:cilia- and flagella-associated protein 36 n=1 Tax=Teleopsis dalmanni TaxID=139649 RepID=UPI0018CC966A|nr:cilia- and flagella-associated protein 36 [Teleopsis dalmanni]